MECSATEDLSAQPSPICRLMPELLQHILLTCVQERETLCACRFVCHRWKRLLPRKICRPFSCSAAAQRGHLGLLQWALSQGCSDEELRAAVVSASGVGHLDVVQWLVKDRGVEVPTGPQVSAAGSAAKHGHLHVVQWLGNQIDIRGDHLVCEGASEGNHLNVLKWARGYGCKWGAGRV